MVPEEVDDELAGLAGLRLASAFLQVMVAEGRVSVEERDRIVTTASASTDERVGVILRRLFPPKG